MNFLKTLAAMIAALLLPGLAMAQAPYEAGSTVNLKSVLTGDTIGDTAARPLYTTSGGSGATSDQVQGNSAAGATDVGNPLKIGCLANSVSPTAVTSGQRSDVWCGTRGQVSVQISDTSGNLVTTTNNASTIATNGTPNYLRTISLNYCWDGSQWVAGSCATSLAASGLTPVTGVSSTGIVLKASAGNVYDIAVVAPASAGYVQLLNLTAVPADATTNTPVWCMPLAANAGLDKTFAVPRVMTTGAVLLFSSTACGASLTKVAAVYLAGAVK